MLEDLGFFVIDNLPPMLIGKVAELARGGETPDALRARRRRALAATSSHDLVGRDRRAAPPGRHARACSSSTRPTTCSCAATRRAGAGIRSPTPTASATASRASARCSSRSKGEADLVVDTSTLNVHELRDRLRELFAEHARRRRRCRSTSCRSATSTACRSTSTSCSTAASCRTRTGSTSCARSPGLDAPVRDYVLAQPGTARVPRRARPPVRADCCPATSARARRTCRSASAAPAAGTAASSIAEQLGERLRAPRLPHRRAPPGRRP